MKPGSDMLMPHDVAETAAVAAPALGNFYFSPAGLRSIFEPAYLAETSQLKSRSKPKLELTLDVNPRSRQLPVKAKNIEVIDVDSSANDHRLVEEKSNLEDNEDDVDSESSSLKRENKNQKKPSTKTSKLDATIERLCSKLQLSIIISILGVVVLVACCCALFLRNRIVKCFKKCCPGRKKKQSKNELFDVENGDYPYHSSPRLSWNRSDKKKKGNPRMVNTGTQDSQTSVLKADEEAAGTVGCSPCCRKKKKKRKESSKKRRK